MPAPGASPYPRSERREAYGRSAGLPHRCVHTLAMDESTLAAVERLHGLGATRVRVGDVEVWFEPQAPRLEFMADEPLSEDERQAAFEKLAYHSA